MVGNQKKLIKSDFLELLNPSLYVSDWFAGKAFRHPAGITKYNDDKICTQFNMWCTFMMIFATMYNSLKFFTFPYLFFYLNFSISDMNMYW